MRTDDALPLEQAVDRFEDAWQHGRHPSIDDHLPPDGPDRTALLVELVHIDLERRLKAGEAVRVETYLRRYPELGSDRVALDLLAAEYQLRRRQENVTAEEYSGRFPQYRDQLTALFDRLAATASVRDAGAPSTVWYAVQPGPTDGLVTLTARYRVVRRHARGGLGEILVARDEFLHREVALKQLQLERAHNRDSRQRFLREAEITSQLEHPGVVPVYGFGQIGEDHPVYAMRFIRGETFLEAIERFHAARTSGREPGPLAFQQLLRRFLSVCNTVGYAHSRGILHRDLKPSNILLGEYGETLVVDWGLAKRIGARGQESGVRSQESGVSEQVEEPGVGSADPSAGSDDGFDPTQAGSIVGTPAYMAPEQAGDGEQVGTASDVYSLGATLYVLLTGQPAFRDTRMVTVLDKVRRGEFPPPRQHHAHVPPALEAVCLKAMARRPEDRYPTALALAGDVEHWLAGEPVGAWPEPLTARARRWLTRHPTLATVGVLALVGLAVLATVTAWLLAAIDHERSERTLALKDKESASRELDRIAHDSYQYRIAGAGRAWWANDRSRAEQLLGQCRPDLRQWEWYHLQRCCHADEQVLRGHTAEVWAVAFSPDGRLLASASLDHTVRVWNAATGQLLRLLTGHAGPVWAVAFSPDGRRLATGSDDETVRLWDAATGKEQAVIQRGAGEVMSCCFSPDGRQLAIATAPHWRRAGPKEHGTVRIWDLASGKEVRTFTGHTAGIRSVAFSPDRTRLASCGYDCVVRLWDARDGRELHTLRDDQGYEFHVVFSPDGRLVASASGDAAVRIWDVATGKLRHRLVGHSNSAWGVAFSPDGTQLASSSDDGTIKIWDVALGRRLLSLHGHGAGIANVAFNPDGRRLASASDDQTVRLWDPSGCRWSRTLAGHTNGVWDVAFSPDGRRLASTSEDRTIRVWDAATGELVNTLRCPKACAGVAFSPDGKRLAGACDDQEVHVWEVATGREERALHGHTGPVWAVTFSPDGQRLASGSIDKTVRLWDVATGASLAVLAGHTARIWAVAFTPDGQRLASGGDDKTVRVWDVATGRLLRTVSGHTTPVLGIAISPDGKTLAASTAETKRVLTREPGEIKLWDLETGEERMALHGPFGDILRVAFSPDGKRLVSGSADGMVRIWDPASGQSLLILYEHLGPVNSVVLSPDGSRLASAGQDGNIILWDGRPL